MPCHVGVTVRSEAPGHRQWRKIGLKVDWGSSNIVLKVVPKSFYFVLTVIGTQCGISVLKSGDILKVSDSSQGYSLGNKTFLSILLFSFMLKFFFYTLKSLNQDLTSD